MLLAIPSKGRAGRVKSTGVLPSAVLFVPDREADDYRKCGHSQVVSVPDHVKGITTTRNWILDNTEARWVVFIDDDVKVAGWRELRRVGSKSRSLSEAAWLNEFVKLFEMTEGVGYRIWGVATQGALRAIYPWKPFIWQTYVTASCMGILNDKRTRFDETFPVKEDYELCLRCIKEDGGIVGARYLYWENSHWTDEGGCKDYRTQSMELQAIRRLIAMYPGLIRQVKRGKSEYSIDLEF